MTDTAPLEIERKFLVGQPPELPASDGTAIVQGYLAIGEDGSEVRIRRKGNRYTLTAKHGAGLIRKEGEIALEKDQFEALWPMAQGRRVEKRRFRIPYGDHRIELDIFGGALAGLILAEVEFPSESESRAFQAPAWFGLEVTEDPRFKNQQLAVNGRPVA